jgi:pimeloyl-ACP methyl ester carboxylesterase/DNA-binding CsgD family transcriptional regulator
VRIAFFAIGEGPALVHMPPLPLSHTLLEWQNANCRHYYEGLAKGRTLIRYDYRGAGLSDRDVSDFSLEAHVRDLEAVINALQLERVALLGFSHSGPAAITYAARHPERVSHLILWCAYANAADYSGAPRVEAARSIIDQDWQLYTEMEGYRFTEWVGGEDARWYTEYLRRAVTPEGLRAAFQAVRENDASALLGKIEAPTLVMHRRGLKVLGVDTARELASGIRDARLQIFDGPWIAPFLGGSTDAVLAAIDGFLVETAPSPARDLPTDVSPSVLTPRETEVLRLIAAGRTSAEISGELSLSVRTVGRHITNLYAKIGARTRADATAYAIRNRLA